MPQLGPQDFCFAPDLIKVSVGTPTPHPARRGAAGDAGISFLQALPHLPASLLLSLLQAHPRAAHSLSLLHAHTPSLPGSTLHVLRAGEAGARRARPGRALAGAGEAGPWPEQARLG